MLNNIGSPIVGKIAVDDEISRTLVHESMDPEEFFQEIDLDAVDVERGRTDRAESLFKDPETAVGAVVELDGLIPALAERDELERHGID